MKPAHGGYRPDIDGLRAIAVLSVLLFHAFPQWLPGGFVGVDIFFVISGFLITGIILQEAQRGEFTVRNFYARRIKRIFPALFLILAFTLAAGWVLLSPSEYTLLDKHVRSAVGFSSNFQYLQESLAYFDPSAHSKLLLHLWSLAIEEQFYVVWPLLIAVTLRLGRRQPLVILGALTGLIVVASLAYDIALLRHSPSKAFYLPLPRAWELLLGGALAIYQKRAAPGALPAGFATALAGAGLALILTALFSYHEAMAFPGAAALVPSLGALLLIAAGPDTTLNRQLLGNRAAVGIGLISYPLYLWHWPLLALAFVCTAGKPADDAKAWLLLLSLGLAWVTYAGLEKPVRRARQGARTVTALVAGMLLLVPVSMSIKKHQGYPDRPISRLINGDAASIILGADRERLFDGCGLPPAEKSRFERCYNGSREAPLYLVLGDSKAEALYYGLVREAADKRWALIGSVGLPTDNAQDKSSVAYALAQNSASVKTVVLVNAIRGLFRIGGANGFITQSAPRIDMPRYDAVIERLQQAGKHVVLVMDNPTLPDPTECIEGRLTSLPLLQHVLFRQLSPYCTLKYSDQVAGTRAYREYFAALKARHPEIQVVDLSELLCDPERDLCPFVERGKFLYSYSDHISDTANSLAARKILPVLQAEARD